ncbi:transposase domain-containing protein [Dongia deserti]|uniref:transposase domain-containing protein n=1 Tax=Dongia deserti TaxID=2268030 RepID=UPI000E64B978|nr:transposase domain-containing protein [Dongia deserti]
MNIHASAAELAGKPGMPQSESGVIRLAKRESWPRQKRSGRGGGWVYPITCLPAETQAALALKHAAPALPANDSDARRSHLWALFERKPQKLKDIAQRRLEALDAVETLIAGGRGKLEAVNAVAAHIQEHPSTIRRWQQLVAGLDRADWLPALAPKWTGRTDTAECSPDAWEFFKGDFLRMSQPRAEPCYRRLEEAAAAHGWTIPSLRTLQRRLARELPPALQRLARGGPDALKRAFPAQRRDHAVFHALEAINGDGHRFDVFVRDRDGKKFRPTLLAWQDIYSGKWVGWRIAATECAELVRLSFSDVCRTYGLPAQAYLDNGRAFASKWNTGGIPNRYRFKFREEEPDGVFKQLGVEIHWTNPYSGQSKPIERGFQDVIEEISKHPLCEGAYTGGSADKKPENYDSRTVPFDAFIALVDDRMRALNRRDGRRSPVCAGRSFDATFAESYSRAPIRKATEEQLRLLLLAAEGVTARADTAAIHLFGNMYWSDAPALARMAGKKVIARFDPQRLADPIHVYGLDGRYLCAAECQELAGFNDIEAAREHARARKSWTKAQRELLQAERTMDAARVAALLPKTPEPPAPAANVIRPLGFASQAPDQPRITAEERDRLFADGMRKLGLVKEA